MPIMPFDVLLVVVEFGTQAVKPGQSDGPRNDYEPFGKTNSISQGVESTLRLRKLDGLLGLVAGCVAGVWFSVL